MSRRFRDTKPRLQGWDYADPGRYFITLVTRNRECLFGQVVEKKMVLSGSGEILREEWLKSFEMRPELHCEAWVIMPNHLHAILCIEKAETKSRAINNPLENPGIAYRPPRSIPSFVAGFKSAATKRINAEQGIPGEKIWQDRYHDHIIRDETEFQKIKRYIETNPARWVDDVFSGLGSNAAG